MTTPGAALPGAIPHPGEQPFSIGAPHAFLSNERYVTEDRMRQIVQTIVQTFMLVFQESRRNFVAMVDRMIELSSHFDTRVDTAERELAERQAQMANESYCDCSTKTPHTSDYLRSASTGRQRSSLET